MTLFALFRERVRIVPRKESGLSSECSIKGKNFTPIYTQNRVAVVSSTESTPLNEIQKNIDKYFDVTYQCTIVCPSSRKYIDIVYILHTVFKRDRSAINR